MVSQHQEKERRYGRVITVEQKRLWKRSPFPVTSYDRIKTDFAAITIGLFDQRMNRTVYKDVYKDRPEQRLCLGCRG